MHAPSVVIDVFAVLLPGAIVAFLAKILLQALGHVPGSPAVSIVTKALVGDAGWVAFFVASYMLGHLIFSLSSRLDALYDGIRGQEQPTALLELVTRFCTKQEMSIEAALKGSEGERREIRTAVRGWPTIVRLLAYGGMSSSDRKGLGPTPSNSDPNPQPPKKGPIGA